MHVLEIFGPDVLLPIEAEHSVSFLGGLAVSCPWPLCPLGCCALVSFPLSSGAALGLEFGVWALSGVSFFLVSSGQCVLSSA